MKSNNKKTGSAGEREAREYLARKGYRFVAKNYRTRLGEIDLVMREAGEIVFVEVKTKTGEEYGRPSEMVSEWKIGQVKRVGVQWCQEYEYQGGCRMDVVEVILSYEGEVKEIRHHENV